MQRKYVVIVSMLSVILAISVFIWQRIESNRQGVCIAEGRVLTEEELEQRFVVSFLKSQVYRLETFDEGRPLSKAASVKFGITSENLIAPRIDEIMYISVGNSKSFKDNFMLSYISSIDKNVENRVTELKENKGSMVLDFQGDFEILPFSKMIYEKQNFDKESPINQFNGYGNHAWNITIYSGSTDCCDGKFSSNKIIKQSLSDNLNSNNYVDKNKVTEKIKVTNCGNVKFYRYKFANDF